MDTILWYSSLLKWDMHERRDLLAVGSNTKNEKWLVARICKGDKCVVLCSSQQRCLEHCWYIFSIFLLNNYFSNRIYKYNFEIGFEIESLMQKETPQGIRGPGWNIFYLRTVSFNYLECWDYENKWLGDKIIAIWEFCIQSLHTYITKFASRLKLNWNTLLLIPKIQINWKRQHWHFTIRINLLNNCIFQRS